MELLTTFGRTLGFSFAAGINLYATVAILGLASRYGWVDLPPQYKVFDNNWIIGTAIALYVIEFFADKIPWIDSLWDTVHTVIRPVGGAMIAIATLGDVSPEARTLTGVLGGALAAIVVIVCVTMIIVFASWIIRAIRRRLLRRRILIAD